MKIKIFVFCLIITFLFQANFNNSNAQYFDAGASLALALPQGEFSKFLNHGGGGLSGYFLYHPDNKTPFGIGLNINFINYGNETRKEPWSTTIPDAYLTVDRSNNILQFHVLFQVAPFAGGIRPYVEGLFGGAHFWTSTSVKSDYQDKELTSSTNLSDWAWSYGGGGGVQVRVYSGKNNQGDGYSVYVDLKGRYLYGTEAEYLKEGSITISNGKIIMNPSKSKTDLLFIQLGVTATFSSISGD